MMRELSRYYSLQLQLLPFMAGTVIGVHGMVLVARGIGMAAGLGMVLAAVLGMAMADVHGMAVLGRMI